MSQGDDGLVLLTLLSTPISLDGGLLGLKQKGQRKSDLSMPWSSSLGLHSLLVGSIANGMLHLDGSTPVRSSHLDLGLEPDESQRDFCAGQLNKFWWVLEVVVCVVVFFFSSPSQIQHLKKLAEAPIFLKCLRVINILTALLAF